METTELINLKFTVGATDTSVPLGIRVLLDNNAIYENAQLSDEQQIEHQMLDNDSEHELVFELFGKKSEHTKINDAGEIVSDAMLFLKSLEIDGIDFDKIFQELAIYSHNFNGTQSQTNEKFYGSMGCNGTVTLKFTTPIYLWLLEHM